MKRIAVVFASLLAFGTMCSAQANTPEKQQLVDTVAKLEAAPLDKSNYADRDKALNWLIETKDVTVGLCSDVMQGVVHEKKNDPANLTVLFTLALGRFVILHPDQADDQIAANQNAIETVLKAYKAVLQKQPKSHIKQLDSWLQLQQEGKLVLEVQKLVTSCVETRKA